eukprot:scaffold71137_cov29-Prasinocladus_malaysianus.AAC.1
MHQNARNLSQNHMVIDYLSQSMFYGCKHWRVPITSGCIHSHSHLLSCRYRQIAPKNTTRAHQRLYNRVGVWHLGGQARVGRGTPPRTGRQRPSVFGSHPRRQAGPDSWRPLCSMPRPVPPRPLTDRQIRVS